MKGLHNSRNHGLSWLERADLCTLLSLASIFQKLNEAREAEEVSLASVHACPRPLHVFLVRRNERESYLRSSIQNPPDPGWMKREPFL